MVEDSGWMADRRRIGACIRPNGRDGDSCRAAASLEELGGRRFLPDVAGSSRISPAVRFLDLTPRFRVEAAASGLLDRADDAHKSARGREVAAEELAPGRVTSNPTRKVAPTPAHSRRYESR